MRELGVIAVICLSLWSWSARAQQCTHVCGRKAQAEIEKRCPKFDNNNPNDRARGACVDRVNAEVYDPCVRETCDKPAQQPAPAKEDCGKIDNSCERAQCKCRQNPNCKKMPAC